MTQDQIRNVVLFAAVFLAITYIADAVFFQPNLGKSIVQTIAVTAVWAWCMKRWYWDKKKPCSPER